MSKQAVRRSFDRAATSYDAAATLQRQVCHLLLGTLDATAPARILDAGCGTGHALGLLARRWPQARIAAADFAPAMVAAAGGGRIPGICADIESLPFADASFDLYWSNLSFQWCDAGRGIGEAARVLAPGGLLAVSSLAPGTLAELDSAFAGTDRHRHVLALPPADDLAAACVDFGLTAVRLIHQTLRIHHRELRSLLRELKALGANQLLGPRRPGLMGRQTWQTVEQRYEAMRETAGLPATFEVVLCLATKPTS
ncbi:MAG: malonyl-ACP O-methyltransferase BioC [Gammaproteobacteria bacterium]|nr:malonyl-ACP O-methyltransferase BioC [Gammaproteobacteria bacterium]MBU1415303.1 malonyl-ACP O-methyltransferase BioC [Gammaproteobacteria bacterium]